MTSQTHSTSKRNPDGEISPSSTQPPKKLKVQGPSSRPSPNPALTVLYLVGSAPFPFLHPRPQDEGAGSHSYQLEDELLTVSHPLDVTTSSLFSTPPTQPHIDVPQLTSQPTHLPIPRRLLAYLHNRKTTSNVQTTERILNHPERVMHLTEEDGACRKDAERWEWSA